MPPPFQVVYPNNGPMMVSSMQDVMQNLVRQNNELHAINRRRMNPFMNDSDSDDDSGALNSSILGQLPKSSFKVAELPANATDAEKNCVICMSEYEEGDQ